MICRRVQRESDELLYTVWSLVMVRNRLPAQAVHLFVPKLQYFLSSRYILSITRTKQIINLLPLNNFYPVVSYRRVQRESDELLYTVWPLVMVRNRLPAQVVKMGKFRNRGENFLDRLNILRVNYPS